MNEITGIKQHFDLLIICLIIKKLQKLGTKIDSGDKDCFDPTGFKLKWRVNASDYSGFKLEWRISDVRMA